MSYDLVFWTDTRADRPRPQEIYAALIAGETVPGLGEFDTAAVLRSLGEVFGGFAGSGPSGQEYWESPDGETVLEISWSAQHLLVTARGDYSDDVLNSVIDVGLDVGGGRLYDPQTGERFDSA